MPETLDFERAWLAKFASCLDEIAGEEIRREVMRGGEAPSSHSGRQEVIDWSKIAMERLEGCPRIFGISFRVWYHCTSHLVIERRASSARRMR